MAVALLSPVPAGTPIERGYSGGHPGIDFAVPVGTAVTAAAAGTELVSEYDPDGYGDNRLVDHGNGWTTLYAHLSGFALMPGDEVTAGGPVGTSGGQKGAPGAGNSSGPHLHFELRKHGAAVDPQPYLDGLPLDAPGRASSQAAADAKASALGAAKSIDIPIVDPILKAVAGLPAEFLKVLTGGRSLQEVTIRGLEVVGGAIVAGVAGVMFLRIIVAAGETRRATVETRRAARAVLGGTSRRPPASSPRPASSSTAGPMRHERRPVPRGARDVSSPRPDPAPRP